MATTLTLVLLLIELLLLLIYLLLHGLQDLRLHCVQLLKWVSSI